MRETARGDLAGAVAQFEAALGSATSENQALRNFVGRLKLLDQRPEEALSDFESMLESNPQDVQAWIGAIQAAILAEKQDDAARLLEGVRAIAPDDPEVLHLTGLLQMERGEYDEAIETFEKALEKQPETPHTEFALGVCLLQTGKTQAAELALNSAFQATPTNTPLFRTLIQHYKAAGNIDRMAAIARKRLEAIPGDNEAFLTLIDRAIFREDPLRMSAIAEDMEKQGLDPSPAYLGLALFAGMQNNEQEAMRRYRQVLENQPDNLIALNNLAWMEAQAGKYDSALERIDRCIEFYPGEADVWDTRGWILKGLNRLQEARESYQQAIQIAPERPDFLLHLGELEAEDGNGEQARQYLESALNKGLVGEPAERAQMLLQKITADSQRGN
jgi:tetratricopeptide (TPR) repeat protein